jgi:hypothetical protein
VRLKPRPLQSLYLLGRRLDGAKSWSGTVDKREMFCICWESIHVYPVVHPVSSSMVGHKVRLNSASLNVLLCREYVWIGGGRPQAFLASTLDGCVIGFTLRLFRPRGGGPCYYLSGLGVPQRRPGHVSTDISVLFRQESNAFLSGRPLWGPPSLLFN